jgi:DNA end-binding protein Ku
MASTVWKGYLTFGLISVPIRLFAAARTKRVAFHQIHRVCDTRIREQLYCPTCERTVERSEIVRGYEIATNRWVAVEDEEIKKIAPRSTSTMEILEFVKLQEIDPLYFDASYYAVPDDPGRKAYQLLVDTMEKSSYAAVAKVGMHQREYVVVIRPRENGLTLHTIYYPNEVRAVPEYGQQHVDVAPREIQLAEQLVKSLAGHFDPKGYEDEYQKRLVALVEAKGEGRKVTATPHRRLAPVVDLMQALQKSLASADKKNERKPASKATVDRRVRKAARG